MATKKSAPRPKMGRSNNSIPVKVTPKKVAAKKPGAKGIAGKAGC